LQALRLAVSRLKNDWLLLALLVLTVAMALYDPRPPRAYLRWLDVSTLAGLAGLLMLTQAVCASGYVQLWALRLVARLHGVRALAFVLVALSGVLSTVLTNDVALFLVVPLTLAIARIARVPQQRLVIFEALAVNAGSTFSPIGNPQNLLLWQHSGLSFPAYVAALAPAGAIMSALLLAACWFAFPAQPVLLDERAVEHPATHLPMLAGASVLLLGMVAALQWGYAIPAMLAVLAIGIVCFRRVLAGVDWVLLLTFAVMFVGLGHFAALPAVRDLLGRLDWHDPRVVYAGAIVAAQCISNVPAAVLLQHYTGNLTLLATAVNVGGYGVAIGSLANLIALRLEGGHGAHGHFHLWSAPFLVVSALLVGLVVLR